MIKPQPDLDLAAALLALRNIDALARQQLGHRKQTEEDRRRAWVRVREACANGGLVDQGITR